MTALRTPAGLSAGGAKLWRDVTEANELDAPQQVLLLEACRSKDRLDKMDKVLRGDKDVWMRLTKDIDSDQVFEVRITQVLGSANNTANIMKQLIATLRLPDAESGKKPQVRSTARGAHPGSGAVQSALERARAAKTA